MSDEVSSNDDLELNFFDLDETKVADALFRHSGHMVRINLRVAELKRQHARLKARIKSLIAAKAQEVRKDPVPFLGKLEKPTAAAIDRYLEGDEMVLAQNLKMVDLEHKLDRWKAVASAMDARAGNLSDLVKLYNSGYWSDPGQNTSNSNRTKITERLNRGKE